MTSFEHIIVEDRGAVRVITLNRPKALNALNVATLRELGAAIADIGQQSVRAVVVTGAGEKAFVAGADITEMKSLSPLQAQALSQLGHQLASDLARLDVPVIAAV